MAAVREVSLGDVPFERTVTPAGVVYGSELVSSRAPFSLFPLGPGDADRASRGLKALEALWFEERVEEVDGGYRLPTAELYCLEPAEASALGLPSAPSPLSISLRTRSYAGSADFRVDAVVRHPEHGEVPAEARRGVLFELDDVQLLASSEAAELFEVLDRGAPARVADQLLYVAEVRRAAERCGAELDAYLSGQDVVTPEAIGVEIEADGADLLRLRPTAEGAEEFPGFDRGPTRGAYTRVEGARRKRLVLDEESRRTADEVKRRGEIRGADVPRFLDNPEAFLPEGIDLSRYSLRVRGLVPRKYNSQPYVRLQPTEKRGWFDLDVGIELAEETFAPGEGGESGSGSGVPTESESGADPSGEDHPGADTDAGPPPHVSPAEYADLCREVVETGERYVRRGDTWIEIDPQAAEQYLRAWDASEEDASGARRIPEDRARLVLDVVSNVDELEFVSDEGETFVAALPEYDPPGSLEAELMPHQRDGYRWVRYLYERGYGGLLADDMGLGKTVQVISLLAHLADAGELQPALIVLPISLVENWRRELARFCPRIRRVYAHHGSDRLRSAEAIAQWEVVLTSYETLRRDQLILGQVDWSVIACDEAQKVKNPTAQATSAVKGMKARLRLAMTGTPVENGLSELWCIVDWAQPGKLGSQREFREVYERPMQAAEDESRMEISSRLQHQLTPHYLRRIKGDVLHGLPPREDRHCVVPLGPRQLQLYAEIVSRVQAGDMIPLEGIQRLLAVTSHPELYQESKRPVDALIDECPKLGKTIDILRDVQARGEKAVIFTRFRRMQQILQDAIDRHFGVHAAILNGGVQGGRRQDLVDRFNDRPGFGVLILSPEAAGVGLNIVGANHVIHYTRLWNPAREDQATDRVHRIGQTRPVTVYHPIAGEKGAEERLHDLLEEKRKLARDVVRPRESLSVERELFDIFEQGMDG